MNKKRLLGGNLLDNLSYPKIERKFFFHLQTIESLWPVL